MENQQLELNDLPGNVDWDALLNRATQHKILPLILSAVSVDVIAEMKVNKQIVFRQVGLQMMRTRAFLKLYQKMKDAGFHPLVVKGILCRSLYCQGDLRPSSDEDLYVSEMEFEACCEFLADYGMIPTRDLDMDAYEIGWRSRDGILYVELHRRLFSPDEGAYNQLDGFFLFDEQKTIEYRIGSDVKIASFAPHEHLLYLFLHAYKHFVHSGFGIRQVCDIALWAQKYATEIDWDRLVKECSRCNAWKFSIAVLSIARHFLNICVEIPKIEWISAETCMPLVNDILCSGIYGTADKTRQHSATVTLNAVEAYQKGKKAGMLAVIFPQWSYLKAKYTYLKKYPILLPVAWIQRIFCYLIENRKNSAGSAVSISIAKERIELLKMYGIIK